MAFERLHLSTGNTKTDKLFHKDVGLFQSTAKVLEVQDEFVVLDQTIFYAESGGQLFDTGFINDVAVVDVQDQGGKVLYARGSRVEIPTVKVDTTVVHRLASPAPFDEGEAVILRVDGERRRRLMKSHSASHFLFHAARLVLEERQEFLYSKGCHITEDSWRFDFSNEISSEDAQRIERIANDLIGRGGRIEMLPSEVSDEVFYWTWEDVVIPCGGTHVRDASELAAMKVSRSKKGTNLTRVKAVFI